MVRDEEVRNVRETLAGARALQNFFNRGTTERDFNAQTVAEQLVSRYNLNHANRNNLWIAAEKANGARELIRSYEENFGLDEENCFIDARGLYKKIHGRKSPEEISAVSHGVAVQFTKKRWTRNQSMGFTSGEGLISARRQGSHPFVFYVPNVEYYKDKIVKGVYCDEDIGAFKRIAKGIRRNPQEFDRFVAVHYRRSTIAHELRHVIDKLIPRVNRFFQTSEVQACLYETFPNYRLEFSIERDFDMIRARQSKMIVGQVSGEEIDSLQSNLIQGFKPIINLKYDRETGTVGDSQPNSWFTNNSRVLSYVCSTTSLHELPGKLHAIYQVLKETGRDELSEK